MTTDKQPNPNDSLSKTQKLLSKAKHIAEQYQSQAKTRFKNTLSKLPLRFMSAPPFMVKVTLSLTLLMVWVFLIIVAAWVLSISQTHDIHPMKALEQNIYLLLSHWKVLVIGGISFLIGLFIVSWWLHKGNDRQLTLLKKFVGQLPKSPTAPIPSLETPKLVQIATDIQKFSSVLDTRQYVTEYIQSITQQLKTPLSSMKESTDNIKKSQTLHEVAAATKNVEVHIALLQKFVARFEDLIHIEHLKSLPQKKPINISEQLDSLIRDKTNILTQKTLGVTMTIRHDLRLEGDSNLFAKALTAMMDNAIEASEEKKHIQIDAQREGKFVRVAVLDQGKGISDEIKSQVTDRFFTASPGKKSGIGLNFVQVIAKLHGGHFTLENRESHGASACLFLPEVPKKAKPKLNWRQKLISKIKSITLINTTKKA